MRIGPSNFLKIPVMVVLVTMAMTCAWAQEDQSILAARMADVLSHSKQESVVVFDFVGSNETMASLGTKLADDFNDALGKSAHKFQITDRSKLKKLLQQEDLEPRNVLDPGVAFWLAHDLGDTAVVLGKFAVDITGVVSLSIVSYRIRDGSALTGFTASIPLTSEMKSLIPKDVNDDGTQATEATGRCVAVGPPPCGGTHGYSTPRCKSCPPPTHSGEALDQRLEGTVLLMVIIDESGTCKGIKIIRALPDGLTKQAITAVQKWKFQPATGPDGKPSVVRQPIEVSFHLM